MNKNLVPIVAGLFAISTMFSSCSNDPAENFDLTQPAEASRAFGDKTPIVSAYYEINDTNPLNALSYKLGTSATGPVFIDLVHLFASNIHKDGSGNPSIFFNDKMTNLMNPAPGSTTTGYHKYVKPLQDAGIKVCLAVLGDWKGIGVANLTPTQASDFAKLLCWIVDTYELDGITFDDEYANYSTPLVNGSYGNVIKALRAKFNEKFPGQGKLINVFQWGNYGSNQIDCTAGEMLDYVDQGVFGPNVFPPSSSISCVSVGHWMPQAINMGSTYNSINLTNIKNRSLDAKNGSYGGIMLFNVRKHSNVNPLPVFQRIAQGAFSSTVTYNGIEYSQDWTFVPSGYTITNSNVPTAY